MDATEAAVDALLARGFSLDDIVIVTGRGRDRSVLLDRSRLGTWSARRFMGTFDRNGAARWTSVRGANCSLL